MRSQNIFYFFITDSQGRSAYWNGLTVQWLATPTPLEFSPDGWQDTQVSFQRSSKYFGINRQLTNSYTFVEDGANILRHLLYKGNSYETQVYLNVNKWNDLTDTYDPYYKGEIDLIRANDIAEKGIQVNLIEGGLLKLMSANDGTDYEIPITGYELVQMDPVTLANKANYSFINVDVSNTTHYIPIIFLTVDQTLPGFQYQSQDDVVFPETSFFFYTELPQNIVVTGSISATRANNGFYSASYIVRTSSGDVNTAIVTSLPVLANTAFTVPLNLSIAMPAQSELIILGAFAGTNSNGTYLETSLQIDFDYNHPSSICKAIKPKVLLNALLSKMFAGSLYELTSELLDENENLLVTSGDGLREAENALIKTNVAKFFDSFNKILFAAMGVSGIMVSFETRQDFYDSTVNDIDLGEVSELNTSVAEDQIINTVKVGYPSQDIETLNGKYSFNNSNNFKLPVLKVQKEYDQVSEYITDPYVIENIRANFKGRDTTDNKNDNTKFILNVVDAKPGYDSVGMAYSGIQGFEFFFTGLTAEIANFAAGTFFTIHGSSNGIDGNYRVVSSVVDGLFLRVVVSPNDVVVVVISDTANIGFVKTLKKLTYDSITGVPATSNVYNIEQLTPKRMLMAHAPYFRSLIYYYNSEKITFLTAERNKDLVTVLDGVTVNEAADVRADLLGDPLFYPYVFSFKTRIPDTFLSIFNNAVNGHVAFKYNGVQLYGFPLQMSAKPALNEAQDWKLLASPANNIQLLVDLVSNPLNGINMSTYGLSFSHLSPVQMVPQTVENSPQYHFRHMDSFNYKNQSEKYGGYQYYAQKWQTNDTLKMQCITRALGPVRLEVINCHGRIFETVPMTVVVTAAVATPYILYQADIELTDLVPGTYWVRCIAGVDEVEITFISEPMEIADEHENTLLIEYSNSRNQSATIFSNGYNPQLRIEGNIYDFVPKSRFSSYEDEPANIHLIEGTPFRSFSLFVGDSFGLPNYMADKINRIFTLNSVTIDGKAFTRDEDAQIEAVGRVQGMPGTWWKLNIRESMNSVATTQESDGTLNPYAVLINVDTALFGDLTSQVTSNPVQIEVLNQP